MAGPPHDPARSPHSLGSLHPALQSPTGRPSRQRLWLRLATYRPLLLVAGLWFLLVAIALVAYGHLLATGTPPPPRPTPTAPPLVLPETSANAPSPTDSFITTPNDSSTNSPGPTLIAVTAMVVLCVAGCFLLGQHWQVSPPQRTRQVPRRVRQIPRKGTAPDSTRHSTSNPTPTSVEIVPPEADTPVDWPSQSLVNQADRRSRSNLPSPPNTPPSA